MAKKIILVDDEKEIIQLLEIELQIEGYDVMTANEGASGLKLILETKPDLVVLDIVMPEMSGLEVLTRLKADETAKNIPVILLTANTMPEDIQRGLDLGADDYMVKPFYAQLLIKKIQQLLV